MTQEVLHLLFALYRQRTVEQVKAAFIDRVIDVTFAQIGRAAVRAAVAGEPTTLISAWTHTELVWLGYEISVDSKYLGEIWR